MNINYYSYYIAIIENNFNLSLASKKVFVSQSTLSKIIKTLEIEYSPLFMRSLGRLVGLTAAGELLYEKAKEIISTLNSLRDQIDGLSQTSTGIVKLGIPPLIVSALFSQLLNDFYNEHPNIKIEIYEVGSNLVCDMISNNELDFGVIFKNDVLNQTQYNHDLLHKDQMNAYVYKDSFLASKDKVSWRDFYNCKLLLLDDSFTLTGVTLDRIKKYNVKVKKSLVSSQWDFLASSIKNSSYVAILPPSNIYGISFSNVIEKEMEDPIMRTLELVYPKKSSYSKVEMITIDFITSYFKNNMN